MPQASGASLKYAWMDHDPAYIDVNPPTINVWNEVYHDYDVRQLDMAFMYRDDEETGATVEVRWTCDGNVYLQSFEADDSDQYHIMKTKYPSTEAVEEILSVANHPMAVDYRDKRALDFRVEVRVTSVVGTNAHLEAWALYETLEVT